MTILVATSSKHGSTREIGSAIARVLRMAGFEVARRDLEYVKDLSGFGSAVIGTAVYMGRPTREATQFVHTHQAKLKSMPVWLFASGPLGADDPIPADQPAPVSNLAKSIDARGFQIFAGRLTTRELGLFDRVVVRAVHAPGGDFRDWDAINSWADSIVEAMRSDEAPARYPETALTPGGPH
jgi:menaquinone-dependent protoporphyrinogen oxidase